MASQTVARAARPRPGGCYGLTEREMLGLTQICARLIRGPHLTEHEQAALGAWMHRLLNDPPCSGSHRWHEPIYGLIRKPLAPP